MRSPQLSHSAANRNSNGLGIYCVPLLFDAALDPTTDDVVAFILDLHRLFTHAKKALPRSWSATCWFTISVLVTAALMHFGHRSTCSPTLSMLPAGSIRRSVSTKNDWQSLSLLQRSQMVLVIFIYLFHHRVDY